MYWTTHTTYVDVETGETLTKLQVQKKYDKLKYTQTHTKKNDTYGIRNITWHCERKRQTELW